MGMKLASAMLCVLPAYGQAVTGEILGTATDATGAVVADDSVAVRNRQTNSKKEARTSNFRINEGRTLQFHANFFNTTNTRDWGIPDAVGTSASFLLEGPTEGGSRRVMMGLRYVF